MSEKDRSASAQLIGKVHAMRRRRRMTGKAYRSHAPNASRRSLEVPSLLTATLFAIFAAHSQEIWEMEGHSTKTTCLLLL